MSRRSLWRSLLLTCPALFGGAVAPQAPTAMSDSSLTTIVEGLDKRKLPVGEAIRAGLENPETLNEIVRVVLQGKKPQSLLDGLNLEFTTLKARDSARSTLGLAYEYQRTIKRQDFQTRAANETGLLLDLSAQGNIAFDRSINPRDFLEAEVGLHFFRSRGGAVGSPDSVRRRLNELDSKLVDIEDRSELRGSALTAEFIRTASAFLTTQTYVDLTGTARLEADQTFDRTQWVYGAQLGLDVKAWNANSTLAQWNLFDWPFALVRYLSGVDTRFRPRGSTIPTVQMAVELVDPSEDPAREEIGETESYPRVRLESAFRSLLTEGPGGPIYFESDLRYYRELGADDDVEAAGLHEFAYFASAIVSQVGMYLSYSWGRLPFDVTSDQVYALGFRVGF